VHPSGVNAAEGLGKQVGVLLVIALENDPVARQENRLEELDGAVGSNELR